jgi:hypothetical protein
VDKQQRQAVVDMVEREIVVAVVVVAAVVIAVEEQGKGEKGLIEKRG